MVSTVSMPVKISVAPLTLADYAEMPYSSALLLDSKFDASLTDDPEFGGACESGFDAYFEVMYQRGAACQKSVFVEKYYTWEEIAAFVMTNVFLNAVDEEDGLHHRGWQAGFVLGWLSALALTEREMALRALTVAETLLLSGRGAHQGVNREPVRQVYYVCPRAVDSAGWPLDL